jgi:hypothetical protein
MNAQDVQASVGRTGVPEGMACWAVGTTLPILRDLRDQSSRWRLVIRLGLTAAIAALETWHSLRCGSDP